MLSDPNLLRMVLVVALMEVKRACPTVNHSGFQHD